MKEEGILFIHNNVSYPKINGVIEAFNKNIINKLEDILLDNDNNFDIEMIKKKKKKYIIIQSI